MTAIRVVGLDLDDTLWETPPVIRRANQVLFDWLTERYPRMVAGQDVDSLHRACIAFMDSRPEEKYHLSNLRRSFLRHLAAEAEYAEDFVEEAFQVFLAARNRIDTLFDDTLPVLERLRKDHHLVALTNGNACVERVGIGHLFAAQWSSEAVGAAKPAPDMFHAALAHFRAEPEEMVHVGDHPRHDVQGALNAGIHAVWLNRDGSAWPQDEPVPHAEIRSLVQLPQAMARLAMPKPGGGVIMKPPSRIENEQ